MGRILFVSIALWGSISNVWGQEARHYRVVETEYVQAVDFTLKAAAGACIIKPTKSRHPINIFGHPEYEKVKPVFDTWMHGETQMVNFFLEQEQPLGLGKKLSYSVFNEEPLPENKKWHIYLTDALPLSLNLNYGIGKADVDLSEMSVRQLKVNTGSADVRIGYAPGKMNKVEMDTFMVKVSMGSLNIEQVNLSRARVVIAEVGFGTLNLGLDDRINESNRISASVGAGNLNVSLPPSNIPVIVYINNSPLCRISLGDGFHQVKPNVYANSSYRENAKNLLTFDLDVGLGKISFLTK